MKKILVISFITLGLLASCVQKTENKENPVDPETESIIKLQTLFMTPSELQTEEEQALLKQLSEVVYDRVTISENRFNITISKEEWEEKGFESAHYDLLVRDVENLNLFMDTTSLDKQTMIESYLKVQSEYKDREKLKQE